MKKTLLCTAVTLLLNTAYANNGLELGTDSIANGSNSISTGKNSIAIGSGSVATGDNLSKEKIEQILKDNEKQLSNIEALKKQIGYSEKTYSEKLQIWERVDRANKQIAKNNEYLAGTLNPELMNLNIEYAKFKPEHDAIVADMNSRLNMIQNLDFTLIGEDPKNGLNILAKQLKNDVEEGYSFSLDQDFYKSYIDNYMNELGNVNKIRAELKDTENQLKDSKNNYEIGKRRVVLGNGWRSSNNSVYLSWSGNSPYGLRDDGKDLSQEDYDAWHDKFKKEYDHAVKVLNNFEHEHLSEKERERALEEAKIYYDVNNATQLSKLYLNEYYEASEKYGEDSPQAIEALQKRAEMIATYQSLAKEFESTADIGKSKEKELKAYVKDVENGNIYAKSELETEFQKAIADTTNRYNELNKSIKAKEAEIAEVERKNAQLKPSEQELKDASLVESVKKKLDADKQALADALEALALNDITDIGENAIAIGHNTLTTGKNAIGMGTNALVTGENAVGIGNGVIVTGENAVALGSENTVTGKNALALGFGNVASALGAIAIGSNASATAENAVAIGANSISDKANTVSFGNKDQQRKLVNVADGAISKSSNEAVNGSQLYATNTRVDANEKSIADNTTAIVDTNSRVDANEKGIANNTAAIADTNSRVDVNEKGIAENTAAIVDTNSRVDLNEKDIANNTAAIADTNSRVDINEKGIAENTTAITDTNSRVDANEKDIAENTAAIADTNSRVDINEKGIADNTAAITDTNSRVDANEKGIAENTTAIIDTNSRVDINEKAIADNTTAITDTNSRVDANEKAIADTNEKVSLIEKSVADTNVRVDLNEKDIANNKKAIADTNIRVDANEKAIADTNIRVDANEKAIADTNTRVDANEKDIADNTTAIADTNSRVDANEKGIADNTTAIADTNSRVDVTEKIINDTSIRVDANEKNITDNKASITKNTEAITDTNSRVDANEKGIAENTAAIVDTNSRVDLNEKDIANNTAAIADTNSRVDINEKGIADNTKDIDVAKKAIHKTNEIVKNHVSDISKHFGGNAYIDRSGNLIAPEYILNDQNFDNVGDSLTYLNDQIKNNSGLFKVDGDQIVIRETEATAQATQVNMGGRKITGVANGDISEKSTEAVNGSQLWATNQAVENNSREIVHLNSTINHYGNRIQQVEKTVHQNRKIASAGIASAMSMGSIPYVDHAKYSFGMGMATYDGESAISMGITWKFNGDQARFRINAAYDSQNKVGVGMGVAFEL